MIYSIVIPAFNEAENLPSLLKELSSVCSTLHSSFEIILINDGSTDNTEYLLSSLHNEHPQLRHLCLPHRIGQSGALYAGINVALGEWIITLDADGQNCPSDIPKLIQACTDFDCVASYRKNRQDTWTKKFYSYCANTLRRWMLNDTILDTGSALRLYKTSAFRSIPFFSGAHRFIPSLLLIYGYKVTQIPVEHRKREHGVSHYSFKNRGFSTFIDLLGVSWLKKRNLSAVLMTSKESPQ
jgi:dolichol-phosphate mannosyltransferase